MNLMAVQCRDLHKTFGVGEDAVKVLRGVDFTVPRGKSRAAAISACDQPSARFRATQARVSGSSPRSAASRAIRSSGVIPVGRSAPSRKARSRAAPRRRDRSRVWATFQAMPQTQGRNRDGSCNRPSPLQAARKASCATSSASAQPLPSARRTKPRTAAWCRLTR